MKNRWIRVAAIALALSIAFSFNAFAGHWEEDSNGWWFRNTDGTYPRSGIFLIGGKEYAFDENGYMKENSWFQHPRTGKWYYATESGQLASSQWVGNYYVGNDGSMMTNAWIDGRYVGSDGKWDERKTMDNSYYSSYDDMRNIHTPFRDAPLGEGYDYYEYNPPLKDSGLESKDVVRHNW